ncbi:MAG TPA: hypothetical protein VL860_09050 [Planctomycetota bacterium]|nr:hypothetical protein [Planctomycetota bacterium]
MRRLHSAPEIVSDKTDQTDNEQVALGTPTATVDTEHPEVVFVWVPAESSAPPRKVPGHVTWVDTEHDLAVVTLDSALLPPTILAPALDIPTANTLLFSAQFQGAIIATAGAELACLPPLDIVAIDGVGGSSAAAGAPLFDTQGHWVGFMIGAGANAARLTGDEMRKLLKGSVRKVSCDPATFDPAVGGRLTVKVNLSSPLGAPRRLDATGGTGSAARTILLHLNPKSGLFEGVLTLPAQPTVPGQADKIPLPMRITGQTADGTPLTVFQTAIN